MSSASRDPSASAWYSPIARFAMSRWACSFMSASAAICDGDFGPAIVVGEGAGEESAMFTAATAATNIIAEYFDAMRLRAPAFADSTVSSQRRFFRGGRRL